MSEFKGTKTKWNKMDASRFGIPFIIYNEKEETIFQCYGEEAKANALLISKSPILLEEHKNEIKFLKRIKKQLDDLGGSMEYEVEERIVFLEKLCFESVNL